MEELLNPQIIDSWFVFERSPIDAHEDNEYQENPYYGNLLLTKGINNKTKKMVQNPLAMLAGRIIKA